MGASSYAFTVDGKKTSSQILAEFRNQQAADRDRNGHQEGYSADTQTVDTIKFRDKVFDNEDEANDYCLDHAEKWEYFIAVKVVNENTDEWFIGGWVAE